MTVANTHQFVTPDGLQQGDISPAVRSVKVALKALDANGGILAWQNPEVGAIDIVSLVIDATTKSTGALTADFGTTPTSAATSSDNLIDGVDLGTAAGTFNNTDNKGANGKQHQKLAAGKWLTGSKATGAAAGLVGSAYIQYIIL